MPLHTHFIIPSSCREINAVISWTSNSYCHSLLLFTNCRCNFHCTLRSELRFLGEVVRRLLSVFAKRFSDYPVSLVSFQPELLLFYIVRFDLFSLYLNNRFLQKFKIQSGLYCLGRARRKGGEIFDIASSKVALHDELNIQRTLLMHETIKSVQDMKDSNETEYETEVTNW